MGKGWKRSPLGPLLLCGLVLALVGSDDCASDGPVEGCFGSCDALLDACMQCAQEDADAPCQACCHCAAACNQGRACNTDYEQAERDSAEELGTVCSYDTGSDCSSGGSGAGGSDELCPSCDPVVASHECCVECYNTYLPTTVCTTKTSCGPPLTTEGAPALAQETWSGYIDCPPPGPNACADPDGCWYYVSCNPDAFGIVPELEMPASMGCVDSGFAHQNGHHGFCCASPTP